MKLENILISVGFHKSDLPHASIVIINTCAVKHATEAKILYYIENTLKNNPTKQFVITGCLPQIHPNIYKKIEGLLNSKGIIISTRNYDLLYTFLISHFPLKEKQRKGNWSEKSKILPVSEIINKTAIIQTSEGCNNNCTYCCTTIARGNLTSFNSDDIISHIKKLYQRGAKEFLLTSQDLGNYNYNGMKFHELMEQILEIPGDFQIRLGMMNPDYLILNLDAFLKLFRDHRIYRFIHLPIQSASDEVLFKMKRNYKISQVSEIIRKIKNFDPDFSFSTDIIVGFPTETESDHILTLDYIHHWKPNILNISKYSVRPGTKAKEFHQINSAIIKSRSSELSRVLKKYSQKNFEKWIGWEGEILINEYNPSKKIKYTGRNLYYLPILCEDASLGERKRIRIFAKLNQSFIGK